MISKLYVNDDCKVIIMIIIGQNQEHAIVLTEIQIKMRIITMKIKDKIKAKVIMKIKRKKWKKTEENN